MPQAHVDGFYALVLIVAVSIFVALVNLDPNELDDGTNVD